MEEVIYLKDDHVKITNLRITCDHVTIPIDAIDKVSVKARVNALIAALVVMLFSFWPLFFGWPGVISTTMLLIVACAWLINIYKSYYSLTINVGQRQMKLLEVSFGRRAYLFKVEDRLNDAIFDERKERKGGFARGDTMPLSPSETMQLRQMLQEYEPKNKKK